MNGLLLLSACGTIMIGYGGYHVNAMQDGKLSSVLFLGIGLSLDQMPFCVSHYLMAVKYQDMARVVPDLLRGKKEKPRTTTAKVIHWVLLTLNILAPLLYGWAVIDYDRTKHVLNQPTTDFQTWFCNITAYTSGTLEIVSGIILVRSILKVRDFFRQVGAENYINTKILLRHASAFGLYLLTSTAYFVTWAYFTISGTWSSFQVFLVCLIFYKIGSLTSQILLVCIFWDLGEKINKDERDKEDDTQEEFVGFVDTVVEEFDEDA
jgi:hypothetical protein